MIEVPFAEICEPPIVEGFDRARLKPDGLVIILDGTIVLLLTCVGKPTVVESLTEIGLKPNGLVKILYGAVIH